MKKSFWLLRGLRFVLLGAAFVAVATLLTQYLWNWLVPELFKGPAVSFWQALGLLTLSRVLVGVRGGRPGAWARHRRQWKKQMAGRMDSLSPEERESFRQQMRARCNMGWRRPEEA